MRHCWTLCEASPLGTTNCIAGVTDDGFGEFTVHLDRPLTPGVVTTLTYTDSQGTQTHGVFTSHPGNANADSFTNGFDVAVIIGALDGVPGPFGKYSADIDHSGTVTAADMLRLIDLINGGDELDPWGEDPWSQLPECDEICCPP